MNREKMDDILRFLWSLDEIEHGAEVNYCSDELVRIYRGESRWPEFVKSSLEKAEGIFEPAGVILDADFHESNGNIHRLHEVERRFLHNVDVIYDYLCPRFSLRMAFPSYRRFRRNARAALRVLHVAASDGYMKDEWNRLEKTTEIGREKSSEER